MIPFLKPLGPDVLEFSLSNFRKAIRCIYQMSHNTQQTESAEHPELNLLPLLKQNTCVFTKSGTNEDFKIVYLAFTPE